MDKNRYMGYDNHPAWTAIKEGKGEHSITGKPKAEHPITVKPKEADVCRWNPGAYSLSWPHPQGSFHSYPPYLNCMSDSNFHGDLVHVKSEMPEFCRESELYPAMSSRGPNYAIDGSNSAPFNCLLNTDVNSMDFGNSEICMNFMEPPKYKTSTCSPIKKHGADVKNSTMGRFHRSGNFSSSGCSTSMLPHVSFSKPQNVDGSFHELKSGNGTEVRPNSNFNTREVSSTLQKASAELHCSNSIVRHGINNPMDLSQLTVAGRIHTPWMRSNSNFSSPCSLSSRMHPSFEFIGDARFRQNSIPPYGLQIPQVNVQPNSSAKCFTSHSGSSPLSLPSGSTLISTPNYGTQPGLMPAHWSSQPIPGQQDYRKGCSMEVSESSRNYRHNQSSISHSQLGRLIPLTGVRAQDNASVNSQHSLHTENTHNVDHIEELDNYLFPARNGSQNSKTVTPQSTAVGSFPKRLGLQSTDFETPRTSRGLPPFRLASPLNPIRPSALTGQYQHGVAPECSANFPRVDCYNAAKIDSKLQAKFDAPSHSSLKRKATEHHADARLSQLRKIFSQHLSPGQRLGVQTTQRTTIPPRPLHVKWNGFDDERPEACGEKCMLCKRELSFSPDGLVFLSTAPPPIAVLPCGHTFHDHCLQKITPEDQLTSPPCIPCAIEGT